MEESSAIAMRSISFSYGSKKILNSFNLEIERGKSYCLVGSSGSGKTTTLRLMNGLLKPNSGEVFINGEKFDFSSGEKWRRSMGYSIQGSGLFPHMTLQENLSIIATKEKWLKSDIQKRVAELCDLMSLPADTGFLQKKPFEISGGQQQRIGIARALFMNPSIMLMDEPFSALDPITRSELQKEFLSLQAKLNLTIVLVTHDLPEAFSMADEIILLNQGNIEQKGRPANFLLYPESNYVKEFVHSHSPGNILKNIFLYSVMNPKVYVSFKRESRFYCHHLDEVKCTEFSDWVNMVRYLTSHNQNMIYWIDESGQYQGSQNIDDDENSSVYKSHLLATDNILNGMKSILREKVSSLPVINKKGKLVGVFSEEALNAL